MFKVLDPGTFGYTPACLYLVDLLNKIEDTKERKKTISFVSRRILSCTEMLNELERVKPDVALMIANLIIRDYTTQSEAIDKIDIDLVIQSLMFNVIRTKYRNFINKMIEKQNA